MNNSSILILVLVVLIMFTACGPTVFEVDPTPSPDNTPAPPTAIDTPTATITPSATPEPSSTPTLEPLTVESVRLIGQPGSIKDSGVAENDPLEAINLRADRLTSLEIVFELSRPAGEPLVFRIYAYNEGDPKAREPVVEVGVSNDGATYRAVIDDLRVVGAPGTSVWLMELTDENEKSICTCSFRLLKASGSSVGEANFQNDDGDGQEPPPTPLGRPTDEG